MLRVLLSLASLAFLLTACGSAPGDQAYTQENFEQNQTYSRSFNTEYRLACDAGRRALLSQGYGIDKFSGDMVTGHKDFIGPDGSNMQITFNVTCAPESIGVDNAQVFASAVQDSFTLKKTSIAATVGVSLLGTISLPFSSTDDALVKTGSLTVTRPQFYSGFFDLLRQYLNVAKLEQPLVLPAGSGMIARPRPGHGTRLHRSVRATNPWNAYGRGGSMNNERSGTTQI
jgi:hypothetical protein